MIKYSFQDYRIIYKKNNKEYIDINYVYKLVL